MKDRIARQRAINILICLVLIFNIFLSVGPSYASQDNDSIEEYLPDMRNMSRELPTVPEDPIEEELISDNDSQDSSQEEIIDTNRSEVIDNSTIEPPTNISKDNDSLAEINITNDTWSDLNITNVTSDTENVSDINYTNQTSTSNLTEEELELIKRRKASEFQYNISNETIENVSTINDTNISIGNFTNETVFEYNLTNRTNITLENLSINYTLENTSLNNFTLERVYQNYLGNFTIVSDKGNIEFFRVDDNLNVWFELNNLTNGSNATLDISLPIRLPDDFYFYLWKDINNEKIQVPYNVSVNNETNTSIISLHLQDGVIDDDGKVNGIIEDPLRLFIPDYNVRTYRLDNRSVEVYIDSKKINVHSSTGFLETVKVVDPLNLPEGPILPERFEDKLLKFRITNLTSNSTDIYLDYGKNLEGYDIWKFNPRTLDWYEFPFEVVNVFSSDHPSLLLSLILPAGISSTSDHSLIDSVLP